MEMSNDQHRIILNNFDYYALYSRKKTLKDVTDEKKIRNLYIGRYLRLIIIIKKLNSYIKYLNINVRIYKCTFFFLLNMTLTLYNAYLYNMSELAYILQQQHNRTQEELHMISVNQINGIFSFVNNSVRLIYVMWRAKFIIGFNVINMKFKK